ncbi:DUF1328 domain-containing protein [Palleronia sp.]|uniref:DUF1328 domain-containing protein n=1 Tax=Palleronia sp. TaxID=1940284 RepID=UPI0035C82575
MIFWAFISFAVSLTAGLFGFGGGSTVTEGVAQTLFFVFLGVAFALVAAKVAQDYDASGRRQRD